MGCPIFSLSFTVAHLSFSVLYLYHISALSLSLSLSLSHSPPPLSLYYTLSNYYIESPILLQCGFYGFVNGFHTEQISP